MSWRACAFAALALTACVWTACARAQGFDLRALFGLPPSNSASLANAPVPPDAGEWSGESGASGHPLMTASAIRAGAANFHQCLTRVWPLAERRGVPRALFERYVAGLTPELHIMDLMDSQPEFTKAVWDYIDILASSERIADGRAILQRYRPIFDAVEKAYGVDRHFVAAIWGIESDYGKQIGERSVIRSTATLACIGRRQEFFREEFLSALEIVARGDVHPDHLKGSWAGAFGPTQFMPTSFKRYPVDFDGDGRRDVVDSAPDLIASTANNLKKDGWASGQTWGYEVMMPQGFNFMLAEGSRAMLVRDWQAAGIRRAGGKAFPRADDRGFLLLPAGAQGPGFLMLHNFRVIMKYNVAEAYALAIGHLADRLRGGEPFVQPWPRHERVLTRAERYELQELLARRGYGVGDPDGRLGGKTRNALRAFQSAQGQVPDGFASATVLDRLRGR